MQEDWQRWVQGTDWPDWRSWLQRLATTDWTTIDWAAGPWPGTPWERGQQADELFPLMMRAFGD